MANVGNVVYAVYVLSLPFGPIWFLHAFNQASTAAMLVWYLRYAVGRRPRTGPSAEPQFGGLEDDGAAVRHADLRQDRRDVMVGSLR